MTVDQTAPRRNRRRRGRVVVAVLVTVVVAWAVWAYAVVVTPRVDAPARVDAVVVLGGLNAPDRTALALGMVRSGLTDTLVISTPRGYQDDLAKRTCAAPPAGVRVVCFDPDPRTTRGEAREVGRLATEDHWTRVAVVTSTYHISRSRMIVGRCFSGTLVMVASHEHTSPWWWAWQWGYQTAGYVKAEILQGC